MRAASTLQIIAPSTISSQPSAPARRIHASHQSPRQDGQTSAVTVRWVCSQSARTKSSDRRAPRQSGHMPSDNAASACVAYRSRDSPCGGPGHCHLTHATVRRDRPVSCWTASSAREEDRNGQ
ncbi:hypothetical protein [Actinomadura yumaensis]|uniref:C3H1-type domain-containing protein n=1 Tax=Actinomadura yumaensis TaxID=111807 RepID=A0ABW2CCP6_9ACTN